MTDNVWGNLLPFFSSSYTRRYLLQCYEKGSISQPQASSFRTCYSFMYHLQHGKLLIQQADAAPYEIRPMLFFYGFIQLIKVCILARDPEYPATTQVLAHGVTTRKRKKSHYRFQEDEVKIQKNGLFSHMLDKMFHMKQLKNDKFRMKQLLLHTPFLYKMLEEIKGKKVAYLCHSRQNILSVPYRILDDYYMTDNRFVHFLNEHQLKVRLHEQKIEKRDGLLLLRGEKEPFLFKRPFIKQSADSGWLLREKEEATSLPPIAIHYLILYNLSMLCRYETEWWGELFHTFDGSDLPIVIKLLDHYGELLPRLIGDFLGASSFSQVK